MTDLTIDDQIAYAQQLVNDGLYHEYAQDILASLERLKAIDSVHVPDYPTVWAGGFAGPQVDKKDYDTLRDLLRRVTAERDACAQTNDDQAKRVFAAEAELAATKRLLVEASKDAERYRWLREFGARAAIYVPANKGTEMELAQLEKLDEAIDAAIKEQP